MGSCGSVQNFGYVRSSPSLSEAKRLIKLVPLELMKNVFTTLQHWFKSKMGLSSESENDEFAR